MHLHKILFYFLVVTGLLMKAQVVLDDFSASQLSYWIPGSSKIVVERQADSTLKVTANGVGPGYEGLAKYFSTISMLNRTKLVLKVMIPKDSVVPSIRIDLTDISGFDSNGSPIVFTPVADGLFHEYVLDYKGKFRATYPGNYLLNPSKIVRFYMYFNAGGRAFKGSVYFDDFVVPGAQNSEIIQPNDVWKYNDDGVALDSSWKDRTFDDATWKEDTATFGYGNNTVKTEISFGADELNKNITTYFRKNIFISDTTVFKNLIVNLKCDDGAVIYVNGKEAIRHNMGVDSISHNTLALVSVDDSVTENKYFKYIIPEVLLDSGYNSIAVAVHQASISSDDMCFDLELTGTDQKQGLTRGPYLQIATDTSIVIKWKTLETTKSTVKYGTSPLDLSMTVDSLTSTDDHSVKLTGLDPNSRYYYAIYDDTKKLSGEDSSHTFVTANQIKNNKATKIWVLGDPGKSTKDQRDMRNAFYKKLGKNRTDVWLLLGDNAYNEGTEEEYQISLFENMFDSLMKSTPVWPCPGNHDLRSYTKDFSKAPYYKIFATPQKAEAGGVASGTPSYYSFDYSDIHFISLDSYSSPRFDTDSMAVWLEKDLAATDKKWKIAYWHHPPHTKGSNDSDLRTGENLKCTEMREEIAPILEKHGIDLILNGHSHNYERSHMIHKHYGVSSTFLDEPHIVNEQKSGKKDLHEEYVKNPTDDDYPNKGTVYAVLGCSGFTNTSSIWVKEPNNLITRSLMYASYNQYVGSMIIDVLNDTLNAQFLDNKGFVRDYFTMVKDANKDVTLVPGVVIGVEDFVVEKNPVDCQIFPNPVDEHMFINYKLDQNTKVVISAYDLNGKKIDTILNDKQKQGDYSVEYKMPKTHNSILIEIKTNNKKSTKKIIRAN